MRHTTATIALISFLLNVCAVVTGQTPKNDNTINLDGTWEYRKNDSQVYNEHILVPGAWQAQGIGEPAANIRTQYIGVGWYRKLLRIPAGWKDQRVVLNIGGAHRITRVFVNGQVAGEHNGFSAPFSFDVTSLLKPGIENELIIRIDNSAAVIDESPDKQQAPFPVGMLNYITSWGGIYGHVTLVATPQIFIRDILVTSEHQTKKATFKVKANTPTGKVVVTVPGYQPSEAIVRDSTATVTLVMGNAKLWSPEHPQLYVANVDLYQGNKRVHRVQQRFGLRTLETRGKSILLNGQPIYLRGYGDDNIEILSGFPPASKEVYLERFSRAKSFGFNAVRYHSMTPTRESFEAADETGMLIMAELPAAYVQYFFQHRQFQLKELRSILITYRNHPSLFSLAFGNEFFMDWLKDDKERVSMQGSIEQFYNEAKRLAPGTMIMSNDGQDLRPTDLISVVHQAADDVPTIRHEFGQYYCSLPDISLIDRFKGPISPAWLEEKKAWVQASGLSDVYEQYLQNSWQLQQQGRKYQIERVRADKEVSGYHYWLLLDYPGGTGEGDSWEEGWFNYFWEPKGITPEEGKEINNPALLLIDANVGNRSFWSKDTKDVSVSLSNYGSESIRDGVLSWALNDEDTRIAGGEVANINAEQATISSVATIRLTAPGSTTIRKLELVITLKGKVTRTTNRWAFWVYPELKRVNHAKAIVSTIQRDAIASLYPNINTSFAAVAPDALLITADLNQRALQHLGRGGSVWLLMKSKADRSRISYFPLTGGANGTFIRQQHPAMRSFTNSTYCDLQFFNLINVAHGVSIDNWQAGKTPVIGGIRTSAENLSKSKPLTHYAMAFEGRVGKGSLFVSTMPLVEQYDNAFPEVITMFDNLLRYLTGPEFKPQEEIPNQLIDRYYTEER